MAVNKARIISDLPNKPVFTGQYLSDTPYTPFTNRSAYGDAVLEYQENVRQYLSAYEDNLEQSRREGLRTAPEVSPAVHMTYLQMIKSWLKRITRRRREETRIAPDPIYTMGAAPIHRTYGPKGRKSRKKRKKTRRKNKKMKGGELLTKGENFFCHSKANQKVVEFQKTGQEEVVEVPGIDGNPMLLEDYLAYKEDGTCTYKLTSSDNKIVNLPRTEVYLNGNTKDSEKIKNKVRKSYPPTTCFAQNTTKRDKFNQEIICKYIQNDERTWEKKDQTNEELEKKTESKKQAVEKQDTTNKIKLGVFLETYFKDNLNNKIMLTPSSSSSSFSSKGNPKGYGIYIGSYFNNTDTCKYKNPSRATWWLDNWERIKKEEKEIDLNDKEDKDVWENITNKLNKLKKQFPNGIIIKRNCPTKGGKKRKKTRRKSRKSKKRKTRRKSRKSKKRRTRRRRK